MAGRLIALHGLAARLCAGALASVTLVVPAHAASHDQIVEACREAFRPQIHACALAKGLKGNPEAVRQQCGAPLVRPCVMREEQKQSAGTPAPVAPKIDAGAAPAPGKTVRATLVAPPRTIADITGILDSEKPDAAKIARKAAADAPPPPSDASPSKLAQFYYDRGNARALLARNKDALADGLQALAAAKRGVEHGQLVRLRQFAALQYRAVGDPKQSIAMFDSIVREADVPGQRGSLINSLSNMVAILISMGDVSQAGTYAGRIQQRIEEARGSPNLSWRSAYSVYGHSWEGSVDSVRGLVSEARGQYPEAEAAYRRAEAFQRAAVKDLPRYDFPPPPEQVLQAADRSLLAVARNESRQGRQSEAEADARRALLEILKAQGKYSPATPHFIVGLAVILVEQGRYQEAEKLGRSALDVQRTLGIADSAPESVNILSGIGNILVAERKLKEAATIYEQLDKAIAQWTPQQREAFELNGSRIAALYPTRPIHQSINATQAIGKPPNPPTAPHLFR